MATTPDCLVSLIGLSDGKLPCFALPTDASEAAAAQASMSGYFLADVEGLKLAPATTAQAAADLYERMAKARKLAAGLLRNALEAGRAKSAGAPLFQQRGSLGGPGNGALLPVGTPAKMSFYTNLRPAGAWRVVGLQLYTDQPVTDAPLLLDGVQQALLSTTGATGVTTGLPPGGLQIPLDGALHTLEVTLPEGVRVRQNNFFAGCFGCQSGTPWFTSILGARLPNGGYYGGSLYNVGATTPGNGFSLTIREECTVAPDLLCYILGSDGADGPAETSQEARYPELVRYLAIALLYKTAELFTDDLLASNATSRYTMLEPKMLQALSQGYAAKYSGEYLPWLNSSDGLGQVQHPCYAGPPYKGPGTTWTGA